MAQGRCIHILVTDASQNNISSTDITYAERQIIETKQEGTTETAHFTYTLDEGTTAADYSITTACGTLTVRWYQALPT